MKSRFQGYTMVESRREWRLRKQPKHEEISRLLGEVENLHPLVAALLIQRDLNSYEDLKSFFNPTADQIDHYGFMKDEEKAAERLAYAVANGEKILLYGDYDVDGTCSVSLMKLFLNELGANPDYYIPDRYEEGYGVSDKAVDFIIKEEYDLVITLDCGITASQQLNELSHQGIDIIICDHHLPGHKMPEVFAIMNPQQEACSFDGKQLCGAGVALMLIRSVSARLERDELWKDYFYLAAIATCSDIVPLTGINRSIVSAGIKQINNDCPFAIEALLEVSSYKAKLKVSDVVFKIGPRINAAGRLKHASLAVELLTAPNWETALEFAREVDKLNLDRRQLDRSTAEEAKTILDEQDPDNLSYSNVVAGEGWNKGVIGIVASRLIEYRYKPTVVFASQNGILTGSARSIEGLNVHDALSDCSDLLIKYGGHAMAAGLALYQDKLNDFKTIFDEAVKHRLASHELVPKLNIDLLIDFSEWYNQDYNIFRNQMNRLRPFGPDHMSPVFGTRSCLVKSCRIVGENHLKMDVYQEDNPGTIIPAIAFGMGEYYKPLENKSKFDLAYTIGENEWNGNTTIQLEVKDIHLT